MYSEIQQVNSGMQGFHWFQSQSPLKMLTFLKTENWPVSCRKKNTLRENIKPALSHAPEE